MFLPTAVQVGEDGETSGVPGDDVPDYQSGFPDVRDPLLVLSVFEGDLFPGAEPQSVYQLQTRAMQPVADAATGRPLRLEMRPGQTVTLPGGRGSVEFESIERWAGISTRYDPVKGVAMWSAILMLIGLLGSLVISRRRVFMRATGVEGEERSTVLLAGLAQREDVALGGLLEDLADDLRERWPGATIIDQTDSRTDRP
ncbi:hypothetical protein GCM10025883_04900 [Mobilicoccus caccae]|uniref:ResB-like domain-containing protein n=1 Tax=Mobilicoccus caccae TaxID=1859295 RepID=A0ABQ6IM70_9MICO|nr:hypothetical protein GCM10025883_04900 [Mobilicoccus caccae]